MSQPPTPSSENHNTRTRDVLAAAQTGNISELQRLLPLVNIPTVWIKAMEHTSVNGHVECLDALVKHSDRMSTPIEEETWDKCLVAAAKCGQLECVRYLVEHTQASNNDSRALRRAAQHGQLKVVQFLLPLSDPTAHNSEAVVKAAWEGHLDCVAYLIAHSDIEAQDNDALYGASGRGHGGIVKMLLHYTRDFDGRCLMRAAANGHMDCVQLLLPHSDPQANNSRALAEAFLSSEWAIFDLLYPHSNATEAVRFIPTYTLNKDNIIEQWEKWVAACQKQILNATVEHTSANTRGRKI